MRRSPLVLILSALVLVGVLGACGGGGDDDAGPTTTAGQAGGSEDPAQELAPCAPLAAIVGIFNELEDVATGSEEGRVAADATLTTALNQLEEVAPDASDEATAAIETLRGVSFGEGGAVEPPQVASDPDTPETDAALATLTTELGGPCGDLGG